MDLAPRLGRIFPFLAAVLVQKQLSLPLDLNLADFNLADFNFADINFTDFNLANIATKE